MRVCFMFTLSFPISEFVLIFLTGYWELYLPKKDQSTLKTVNSHSLLSDLVEKVSNSASL